MKFNGVSWEHVISEIVSSSNEQLFSPGALLIDEGEAYISYTSNTNVKVLKSSVTCDVMQADFAVDSTNTYILTTESNGCVNMDTVFVMIGQPDTSYTSVTSCDNYIWQGITYNTSGVYDTILTNVTGCDSIANLDLTIINSSISIDSITSCETYIWNGMPLDSSGVYTISSTSGTCLYLLEMFDSWGDGWNGSTVDLIINGIPLATGLTIDASMGSYNLFPFSVSNGNVIELGNWQAGSYTEEISWIISDMNSTVFAAGGYGESPDSTSVFCPTQPLLNSVGCDSTAALHLTINSSSSGSSSITSCDTYLWEGVHYDSSGVYITVLTNVSGCDSIATLNLTIINSTTSDTYVTICDNGYSWNDSIYDVSGIHFYTTVNSVGCDSTAALHLTINSFSSGSSSITSCDTYLWEGVLYDSSGVYTTVLTNVSGCDSIATLNLTINYSSTSTNTFYICSGQSITIGENTYNLSGVYIDTLSTSLGCDSIITTLVELSDLTLITSSSSVTCSNWTDGSVSVNVAGGIPPYSYFWESQDSTVLLSNLPDTTPLVSNLPEGSYIVTVLDSLCLENASVNIDLNVAPADSMHPEICYVSVDNTGYNKLVVRPLENQLTSQYVILREYSSNQYQPLDTIWANTTEYIDSASNPSVQAERYRILATDTCGNISDTSEYHKTVHLTMSLGVNEEVNLIWNSYEGFQVSNYLIYRGTSNSNMTMIGVISGNNNSYTDINPPTGFLLYQIRVFAQNCISIPNASMLPDTLVSNIIDHNNTVMTVDVVVQATNPTCSLCNDGSAIANATGGMPPYTYVWSNGVSSAYNGGLSEGTYTIFVFDAYNNSTSATVTLIAPVSGCIDSLATNYDPTATIDDGSCIYPPTCDEDTPTGIHASDIIHNRATINWDNMNLSLIHI